MAANLSGQVEQLKNKLVQKLQQTKFLKELREFDSLIKAIGECKSKSEEDRIILAEIETLRQRLTDPKIDKSRGREYMVRLIYCEMLGHDVSWAYVKAVQFASEPNVLTKKVRGATRKQQPSSLGARKQERCARVWWQLQHHQELQPGWGRRGAPAGSVACAWRVG